MEDTTAEDLVKILESLEPVFVQAGELAVKMQKGVKHHNKLHTGNELIDIVTEADLAVQEVLLNEMVKTPLINCRLLGEEKTPLVEKFNTEGKYFIAIDPIDGTATYAAGGRDFSTIITFHNGKEVLYLFNHYPLSKVTHKIKNGQYSREGNEPQFPQHDLAKSVLYWQGDPEKNVPAEVYKRLKEEGKVFRAIDAALRRDIDIINFFAFNQIAGIYKENPNVYDGITELEIGKATGKENYSNLDLSVVQPGKFGLNYPGYYLALNKR